MRVPIRALLIPAVLLVLACIILYTITNGTQDAGRLVFSIAETVNIRVAPTPSSSTTQKLVGGICLVIPLLGGLLIFASLMTRRR